MKYTQLDNPHAHLPNPKNQEQLESLLFHLIENIEFISVTHWGKRVQHCLQPEDLEEISIGYYGKFKIKNLGHQTYSVNLYNLTTYIYCSQEIRTKQGLHITAEGCDKLIEEYQDARKTIGLVHKQNGKAILEHPFTQDCPLMQYKYVLDGGYRNNIIQAMSMVDGIEVFNSMNSWWQFLANMLAKDSAEKAIYRNGVSIPLLAGGDEHYNLKDIGRVGNLLPKEDLSQATGKEIQEWRWKQYKQGNFKRKEKLTTPYIFFKFMMLPTVTRLVLRKERDSDTGYFGKVI